MICRLCGSDALRLHYTQGNEGEFRFLRCSRCGLVSCDLSVGLDQEKYARSFVDPLDDTIRTNHSQTVTFQWLKKHVKGRGRLLEIGCGNGRLLHLAREAGWTVEGLELSEYLAESVTARLGIPVTVADFCEVGTPAPDRDRYDCIVLRHVLEHLPDPLSAMRSLRSLLAPGGRVLLEFPNIEGIDFKVKRGLGRLHLAHRRYAPSWRPGHCCEYGRRSFGELLDRTGFALVAWETYSSHALRDLLFRHLPIGGKARALIRGREDGPPTVASRQRKTS